MVGRSEALAEAVAPVLAALGLDLYDVELAGSGSGRTLRVTIDRDGGVDLESITTATEAVSRVMDCAPEGVVAPRGSYTLEVTSPGLERTLRTPAHFERAQGSKVSVKTHSGTTTLRRHGVLVAAGADGFDLVLDDGSRDHIAYADVVQARGTKPGAAKSPKSTPTVSASTSS